jgi:hypothetical protein
MKCPAPIDSHTTTEQTSRRQEHDVRMALKRGSFAGVGKSRGKVVREWWEGNRQVVIGMWWRMKK